MAPWARRTRRASRSLTCCVRATLNVERCVHPKCGTGDAMNWGTVISNVARLLWNAAAAGPARPAVVEAERSTDYASLQRRAAAIAAALRDGGLQAHDRVGIFLDGGADAVAAFFGVAAAGGIAVIINESMRPRQVEQILEGAGAAALITSDDLTARQPRPIETPGRVFSVRDFDAEG